MLTVFKIAGAVILLLGVVLGFIERIITKDPISTSTIFIMLIGIGLLVMLHALETLALALTED